MKQRLIGALILLPLILTFFAGNIIFTIFSLVLGIIGFMELKIAFSKKRYLYSLYICCNYSHLIIFDVIGCSFKYGNICNSILCRFVSCNDAIIRAN